MKTETAGFTLIEVLTAMMILAISLVTILQLFSGGLKSARLSDEYTRAIFHAKEKMAEILLADRLSETERTGEFEDGYRWSFRLVSLEPADEEFSEDGRPAATQSPVHLFHITVTVFWDTGNRERHFEISTVHIADKIETEDET
ncbi:hypothetical protein DENIS_1141 [Desulfonema ishimotonii]|uniref:Uncharacterized protein n=1 Tax=Desulfonema ishimotonii TaxID=45657 RepID=A0A401FTA9_9BACT|nr:prepilin-type N-terminal cleavage/methylation domain-containing protein [Desulfonema ishimotonii]GBC60190.1 hypothetical protein DENIS_1141 [Desulfonema ishimotonii]